jgi:hypothetical protein
MLGCLREQYCVVLLRRLISTIGLTAATMFAIHSSALAETRVALVIGNGAYQNAPQLPNPMNDANDVAGALRRDGFNTILATNLDRDGMQDAAIQFARAARNADVALFYYSGHAIQFAGVNYLAPVDIQLNDEADLRRMLRVDEIVSDLQQAKNLRILVLDSCRDNPLADRLKRSIGATRSLPLQRGLAKVDTPQGMIVAYATQAGHTAEDGTGRNSPYTAAFLKNIEAKEEIGTIFRRISAEVYEATQHEQLPELSLSLIGEFYLRGKLEINAKSDAAVVPQDTTREDFEAAERVDSVGGWDAFLAQHPSGLYAALAKERRAKAAVRDAPPTLPALSSSHGLTMQECSAKYKAAKDAGTLDGQKWNEFRQTQCGAAANPLPAETSARPASNAATAKGATSAALQVEGGIVFPRGVDPKYASESPGKARLHTCVDQYLANKATHGNGGMKWIEMGGGYYTECNKRLAGR